jgi:hypothetical protein
MRTRLLISGAALGPGGRSDRDLTHGGAVARGPILTTVKGTDRPPDDLPPLDALQRLLLPAADGFMLLMLSRPPTGTLRTTRVTSPSIGLAIVTFVVSGVVAGLLAAGIGRHGPLLLVPALPLAVLALGSACLALYGLRQRR